MGWKAYVHMAFKKLIQPNTPTKIKIDNTKKETLHHSNRRGDQLANSKKNCIKKITL